MKKLGDKYAEFCEKYKSKQIFEVSEISEYGEVYGMCDTCHVTRKL